MFDQSDSSDLSDQKKQEKKAWQQYARFEPCGMLG